MIVNIKIDTDRLGDKPEVKIDGHDIKMLSHIDFDWTNSQFPSLPSTSKLTIKRLPSYMYGHNITWKTLSHE